MTRPLLALLLLAACTPYPRVHRKMEVRNVGSCGEVCLVWLTNGSTVKTRLGVRPGDSIWVDIRKDEAP